jgi:hypothetical protein
MSATVVREACIDTLMAATTAPAWSRIGAAMERSLDLQLLVDDRVVLAALDLLAQRRRRADGARGEPAQVGLGQHAIDLVVRTAPPVAHGPSTSRRPEGGCPRIFGLMLARALTDRDLSDQLLARGVETAIKLLNDRA